MTIEAVRQLRIAGLTRLTAEHPFEPDELGTQCTRIGCWGWVDDPRHHRFSRKGRRVVPALRPTPGYRH